MAAFSKFALGLTAVMLPDMTFEEQIALSQELGLTHYSLRPRIIPENLRQSPPNNWGRHLFDLTPQKLAEKGKDIAKQLTDAGLTPWGTVPTACITDSDADLELHFKGASLVGAGRVRVAPLACPTGPFDYQDILKKTIAGYKRAVAIGQRYGQKVVIETHCRSLATSPGLALNICQAFDPAELGVIFDIANFNIEGNLQPHVAVAVLGRYIDHVHIGGVKWLKLETDAIGFNRNEMYMCPMTEAHEYLPAWIKALDEAGVYVPLIIEDYTPETPGAVRLRRSAADLKRLVGHADNT